MFKLLTKLMSSFISDALPVSCDPALVSCDPILVSRDGKLKIRQEYILQQVLIKPLIINDVMILSVVMQLNISNTAKEISH